MIAALDFETANASRGSICAVGVVLFGNGTVTDRKEYLVRPHPSCDYFSPMNVAVHGITPSMVRNAPEWDELWETDIRPMLHGSLVVAHNAAFDISVLRAALELYSLPFPEFDYLCTYKLSSRVWPELENHKLDTLARRIGHVFRHHDAQEDAEACVLALEKMMRENSCDDPLTLAEMFHVSPGHVSCCGTCVPCSCAKKKRKHSDEER